MPLGTLLTQDGTGLTFEVTASKQRTWHEAKLSRKARWAKHEVHLADPKLEFLGPGSPSLSLSVRLDADRLSKNHVEGVSMLDTDLGLLRAICDTGQVVQYTIGDVTPGGEAASRLVGDFVLDGMDEEWKRVDAQGRLAVVMLNLSLEAYA